MSWYRNSGGGKRDGNEPAIIRALDSVGATYIRVKDKDAPDLVVGFRGDTFLVEEKLPGERLSTGQAKFHNAWRGRPILLVRTPEEMLQAIGATK